MGHNRYLDVLTFSIICASWLSLSQDENLLLKGVLSIVIAGHLAHNFYNSSPSLLANIFIFGLTIRFFNQSFSSFDELLTTDAALDYVMANILIEQKQLLVIDHVIYDERLSFYSSWPLLHYLISSFHGISGSDDLVLSINMIQIGIYSSCFLATAAIIQWFKENSSIPVPSLPVCVLISISIPELVYWQSEVVRQSLGVYFHLVFVLCVLHISNGQGKFSRTLLAILSLIGLSFAHHLTSAVSMVSFTASVSLFIFVFRYFSTTDTNQRQRGALTDILNLLIIFAVMIIIWWAVIGEVLFPTIRGALNRYYLIIIGVLQYVNDPRIAVPPELSPIWAVAPLVIRDIIIYGGTGFGFILLAFRDEERIKRFNNLTFYSLIFGYVFATVFLLFFGEFSRVLVFASPFMAIAWSNLFEGFAGEGERNSVTACIFVVVLFSFVSPYNHTFANVFYVDDSISPNDAGRPSPGFSGASEFALEHSSFESEIGTDLVEFSLMSSTSPEEVSRFQSLIMQVSKDEGEISYNDSKDIVLLIRDGGLFQYNVRSEYRLTLNDLILAKQIINAELSENRSKVYDSSEGIGIWV